MTVRTLVDHLILITGALFMCAPLAALAISTTHAPGSLPPSGLTFVPGLEALTNYGQLMNASLGASGDATIMVLAFNSFILGTGFAVLKVTCSLLAAYALTYFRIPFATPIFSLLLLSIMLPLESRFLPTYDIVASLGWVNSPAGMIVPLAATGIGTFFFIQYLKSVPDTLVEAARIDGAGPVKFLVDILLPMSVPMISALFIVMFVNGWNQYLWPVLVASDESSYTLVRGLQYFGQASLTGKMLACLSILPPALLVLLFQRQVMKGLFDGSH